MLNNITYGTFLIFGFFCLIMAVWAYVFFPETAGYSLETIGKLFEEDMIVRALQDAPGGKLFLGGRRAKSVSQIHSEVAGHENELDSADGLDTDPDMKKPDEFVERI